jgi:arylsulfatase A-like enzyme
VRCSLEFFVAEDLGTAESRRRYGLEVEYVDRELGRLLGELDRAGRLKNTVIVITSDHGEGLGDHGLMGHISQLYDSLLRVPLLVVSPGADGGKAVTVPVSLVDLRPTTLALLGAKDTVVTDGVDMSPVIWSQPIDDRPPHLCMTFRPLANAELRGMVFQGFKLIRDEESGRTELYDLDSDPGEQRDLVAVASSSNDERLAQYLRRLDRLLGSESDVGPDPSQNQLTDEDRKMLEALGYIDR